MNKKLLAIAAAVPFGIATASAPAAIVINEIDSDTFNSPATDYAEFIELYSTTGTATPLDGLTLVLFNGNGDTSYLTPVDLTGLTTNASGYYVFGTSVIPNADNTTLLGAGNLLQNGQDAVALYSGTFAGGAATTTNRVDAIVYGTGDAPDAELLAALGETIQYDEGSPTPPDDASNLTLSRVPDGSGEFVLQAPTPGGANAIPEPSSLALLGLGGLFLARRRRN